MVSKIIKGLDWTNKWLTPLFSGIAAILGVMWQNDFASLRDKYPNWPGLFNYIEAWVSPLFILFFILAGICSALRIFTTKSFCKIERELSEERDKVNLIANNIETLVNGLLLRLSEKIGFQRGEPSRLTIYIHNNNGHFISFGRYSPDPLYSGRGRNLLPDTSGCISRAWSSDWCYESNLTYRLARKSYGINKESYEPQRMRAVCFAVKRIDSNRQIPLAVLVVESKTEGRFPEDQIKAILDGEEAYLAEIIGCLKTHIPDPQDASERGF